MAMSSSTYLPGFSVIFFILSIYCNYVYFEREKITLKSAEILVENIFRWSTFKIVRDTPTLHPRWMSLVEIFLDSKRRRTSRISINFSIIFRSQFENHVCDNRLYGVSTFMLHIHKIS
jgi:hypothetical protein